jgi:synaptic vesicle membrane protein VAT-1
MDAGFAFVSDEWSALDQASIGGSSRCCGAQGLDLLARIKGNPCRLCSRISDCRPSVVGVGGLPAFIIFSKGLHPLVGRRADSQSASIARINDAVLFKFDDRKRNLRVYQFRVLDSLVRLCGVRPMRQIWIDKPGRPEALVVKEVPDPEPQAGEVRIRVEASGVNFADIMGRMGIYPDLPPLPVVVGYEVGGRVDVVGASVDPVWLGRDVFALTRFGGYSDVVCVPQKQVFARPSDMTAEEGAALPVNYLTAWQLVVVMGGLKRGETVLIHSAGGGVGIAATQIALHIGARVIGVASASKHAELRALGIDHLIDQRSEDFQARTREITAGRGVELVLDAVGGDSLKKGYRLLAPTGRLGTFGVSSAANAKQRDLLNIFKTLASTPWLAFTPVALLNANKGVFGVNLGHMWGEVDRMRGWMDDLLDLRNKGVVRPKIARTFRFDEAPQAHHFIQDRKNVGKVLLKP